MLPKRVFILGGARSGKSSFAESLVARASGSWIYIATAEAHDQEMATRIAAHRNQRGSGWRTIEAPQDITSALGQAEASDTVLIDCATLWLSNRMALGETGETASKALTSAIEACSARVVTVSNEVGQGIVPDNALARAFRDAQGKVNQALAAQSQLAVLIVAGLPVVLKGQLP